MANHAVVLGKNIRCWIVISDPIKPRSNCKLSFWKSSSFMIWSFFTEVLKQNFQKEFRNCYHTKRKLQNNSRYWFGDVAFKFWSWKNLRKARCIRSVAKLNENGDHSSLWGLTLAHSQWETELCHAFSLLLVPSLLFLPLRSYKTSQFTSSSML